MGTNTKRFLRFMLKMMLVWAVALTLLGFFRGFQEVGGDIFESQPLGFKLVLTVFLGFISGILFSLSELFFEKPKYRRWSYGKILVVKGITYFLIVNILLLSSIGIMSIKTSIGTVSQMASEIRQSGIFWIILVYFTIVAILITFVRQMEQKFGPGVLWNMIRGKYRSPKQESRIFMFLDLKSSTTLAEKLGHVKFSKLIQECFYDLNELIPKHKAEIYQYVGDEAVLTWNTPNGLADNNCIAMYFSFAEKLESKRESYEAKYGVLPEFKAGVHFGNVMVAEVGIVKREIAYHGDVLNTTARIQGQCNTFGRKLLISESLSRSVSDTQMIKTERIGDINLKGKEKAVTLFAVSEIRPAV